jgi:acyl-ACP thioesterase
LTSRSPNKFNYEIRYDETDIHGFLSFFSLSNYLQESAGRHARSLGISVPQLQEKNLTWVMMKLWVQMEHYPKHGEILEIETWPSWQKKLYAGRDYLISYGEKEIGRATSTWLVLDLETRRPVPVPQFITDIYRDFPPTLFPGPFPKIPKNTEINQTKPFQLRVSDLDINRHVNHITYMEAAVDSLPANIWEDFKISEFVAEYRSETFYEDTLLCGHAPLAQNPAREFLHRILREKDGAEVCRAKTLWTKI